MSLFDRTFEKKKIENMTEEQKNKQKNAIWNYYKNKKQEDLSLKNENKKQKKEKEI